jgi:hypothetical protein
VLYWKAAEKMADVTRDFEDSDFPVIANIQRSRVADRASPEEALQSFHDVVDMTPAPGLHSVSQHGERLASESLSYEIRNSTSVIGARSLSVYVEKTDDPKIQPASAPGLEEKRLCASLTLVVG